MLQPAFRSGIAVLVAFALALSASLAGAKPAAFSRGLFWRLEKPGASPSYLFGTIHSADPRVTRLPPAVARALAESRSFIMEIRLDGMARQVFADAMFLEPGELRTLIGEASFAEAARRMEAVGTSRRR
jgi:uncharacterized protein YbaP (TraB family)